MNNQTYQQPETVINLKEVIWDLLEQWKAVLIAALLMSLLVMGAKHFKDVNAYNAKISAQNELETAQSEMTEAELIEDALKPLSDDDRTAVNFALRQREWVKSQKDYLNNSILLSVDPTNQRTLSLDYSISDSSEGNLTSLVYGYIGATNSKELVDAVGSAIDPEADARYIAELIIVDTERYANVDADAKNTILEINVVVPEDVDAAPVEAAVTSTLLQQSGELKKSIGDHSIKLVNASETRLFNKDAVDNRNSITNNITNIQNAIKNNELSLSDAAKSAISEIEAIKNAGAKSSGSDELAGKSNDEPVRPGWSKKYAVLGFVLGAMMYAFVYVVWLIMRGRLNYASDSEVYTGARLLGEVYKDNKYAGVASLIHSKVVEKIRRKGKLDAKVQLQKAAETIEAACDHINAKEISILNLTNDSADFIEAIEKQGIKTKVIDVIGDSYDKELNSIDNAVIATDPATSITKLSELIYRCRNYDINVIGSVFEGRTSQ